MTIENINPDILNLCAVCVSETSGGLTALMIILLSFALITLANLLFAFSSFLISFA